MDTHIRHAHSSNDCGPSNIKENKTMDGPNSMAIPIHNENETSSYIFNSSLYELMKLDKKTNSLVMKCTTCFKCIKGNSHSTGNFISHIKVSAHILYFNNCIYKN